MDTKNISMKRTVAFPQKSALEAISDIIVRHS